MFEPIAMQDPAGFLAAVTEQLAKLSSQLWRTGNDGFAQVAAAMDALAVQLDCARVGLVDEAVSRGVVDASPCPSGADWLMAHSFHLEPADAARAVDLARLCRLPKNQVLAAAVAGGTVTVRKAMTVLRQLGQVEHALAPGKREEALGSLTQMAQSGYDRNVIAVGGSLMALVGADRSLERNEHMLTALSCLRLSPMDNGMIKVSGQLDPEAGAVLVATLDPLSAPNPCDANGGRDPRPPDRRRAEALIEVCRRAAAAGGAAPAASKAQIVVTIGYDRLAAAVKGAGTTWPGRPWPPKPSADSPVTPRSSRWSWAPRDNPWTSGGPRGWSPRPCWPRYGSGTRPAPSPAAGGRLNGATPTTSNTGSTADQHPY